MSDNRLKLSAVLFAVLWTAGMWLFSDDKTLVFGVILTIAGAVAGLLWFWLFRLLVRWQSGARR